MSRACTAVLLVSAFLSACRPNNQSREKVQQAILERLRTRSGLDLNQLDVNTTSVRFDKNMAYATVSFHPKGDTNLNSGMVMQYTLQDENGKWVVVKVGDSQGHTMMGGHSGGALPPGHPSVDGAPPPAGANGTPQ